MTAVKAHAGGVGGALSVLAIYVVQQVPGLGTLPDGPAMALQFLISSAICWLCVYMAPANSRPS